uniref:Transposase n=1 Tax=Ascaris lumbricoides TaxID=6252 RepID=A0A0M3HLJ2_ASCLU
MIRVARMAARPGWPRWPFDQDGQGGNMTGMPEMSHFREDMDTERKQRLKIASHIRRASALL